jgi:hypothetical protein
LTVKGLPPINHSFTIIRQKNEKIKSMTTSRKKLTANFFYDFLYVIGGQVSSRKPVNLNEAYPPNCQMDSTSQFAIARNGLTAEVNGTI